MSTWQLRPRGNPFSVAINIFGPLIIAAGVITVVGRRSFIGIGRLFGMHALNALARCHAEITGTTMRPAFDTYGGIR